MFPRIKRCVYYAEVGCKIGIETWIVVGILGFDENCLVVKEKFSAKLLTCKLKKMTFVLNNFYLS